MKRGLISFVAILFVAFASVFASACGDKYKNLEFEIYYAFEANAQEWHDGSNGISLNYNPEKVGGDGSSLVFDDNGATLYVRIGIKNVKNKHVDLVTVSPTSTVGLDFSTVHVENNQAFPVRIVGNVNSTLKLYENNSGKKIEVPFVVSRELTGIVADNTIKPAVVSGGTISLVGLNNLTYLPQNQTNQVGVTYSVVSIGRYNDSKQYIPNPAATQELIDSFVKVRNGSLDLKVVDASFIKTYGYVIRVRATSVFHDGSVEGTTAIYDEFDVYVIEKLIPDPVVNFVNNGEVDTDTTFKQINIYENGNLCAVDYSSSTVRVDTSELLLNTIYNEGLNTVDGKAVYTTKIYVENGNRQYEEYDFFGAKHQAGINGLKISKGENENDFVFSIANRDVERNKVKIAYVIDGLDLSKTSDVDACVEFDVVKSGLPNRMTINNTLDYKNGDTVNANIYGTNNANYHGLELQIAANPNSDTEREILFDIGAGLIVKNGVGQDATNVNKILNNSKVYVNFAENVDAANLGIKTLANPGFYNGKQVVNNEYITIVYQITKLATADKFEFVSTVAGVNPIESAVVNAEADDELYVKIYYSANSLDTSTITVKSNNDNFLFENGTTEMMLSETYKLSDEKGEYAIYRIPIKAAKVIDSAQISIMVADGSYGIDDTATVNSAYLMTTQGANGLNIKTKTSSVKDFAYDNAGKESLEFRFSIAKGEFGEFVVKDGLAKTNTISHITLENASVEGAQFATNALTYRVVSNTTFTLSGRIGGLTQVLTLKVYYYEDVGGQVEMSFKEIKVQVAVIDPVGVIIARTNQNTISYVNPNYTEISSTDISLYAYSASYGTPAQEVVFHNEKVAGGIEKESNASQVAIYLDSFTALQRMGVIDVIFTPTIGEPISILGAAQNGVVLTNGTTNYLEGTITVSLSGDTNNLKTISLTARALRFGVVSSTLANVTINIVEVNKAIRIEAYGKAFSVDSNEIKMSFMGVDEAGSTEKTFTAEIECESSTNNAIKFNDISTALTYIVYKYEIGADGLPTGKLDRMPDDFIHVAFASDGTVTVRAFKVKNGGVFKLVLATKDSYNLDIDPGLITLEERHFDTKLPITLRIEDGVNAAYSITSVDDLKNINFNLDKDFVLAASLGEEELVDISPIGLIGEEVREFKGNLDGAYTRIVDEDTTLTANYSISMKITEYGENGELGALYGLFARIGEDATISNLDLIVEYCESFESGLGSGAKIGALAAVNAGKIDNVNVDIKGSIVSLDGVTAGQVEFGGVVGVNNGDITNSSVKTTSTLTLSSNSTLKHNFGFIAGTNNGTILGKYEGKESLDSFIFDVVANLRIETKSETTSTKYIGGVAGENKGKIEGMMVGGRIVVATKKSRVVENGSVGGVAGASLSSSEILTSTVLSLDITTDENSNINVAGIAGEITDTIINNVKFVTVKTEFGGFTALGQIKGNSLVGGIVAKADDAQITYAGVESFIETIYNEMGDENEGVVNGLTGDSTVGGLVANADADTTIQSSFVRANLLANGTLFLTSNKSETDTYYIGKVYFGSGAIIKDPIANSKATYAVVNYEDNTKVYKGITELAFTISDKVDESLDSVMVIDPTIEENNSDWNNIYVYDDENSKYIAASDYVAGTTYYTPWLSFISSSLNIDDNWEIKDKYNTVTINKVELFFPYLLRSWVEDGETKTEPLLIVAPKEIVADINQDYVVSVKDSVYVNEFDFAVYEKEIKATVIANYFSGLGEEANSYKLFSTKNTDGTYNADGLFDFSILPEDAQGGKVFSIISGHKYAYIDGDKIVFTASSGQNPIVIKITSSFNPDINIFAVIYSQPLFTELNLSSSLIYHVNEDDYDYEVNAYTGQNNQTLKLEAENIFGGNKKPTNIFDVREIRPYLQVDATSSAQKSKLEITPNSHENISLKIKEDLDDEHKVVSGEFEIVTFTLYLNTDYYGTAFANDRIELGKVSLKVNLYNSAKSVEVDGENVEISTRGEVEFDVNLTTDFVNTSGYSDGYKPEFAEVNSAGEIYFDTTDSSGIPTRDGIKIYFDIIDGEDEVERLIEDVNFAYDTTYLNFAELFDVTISSALYKVDNPEKIIGYKYNVQLELKDAHCYRYIENNIKFAINVVSTSNPDVTNANSIIEVTLKPSAISTARIENYNVEIIKVNTDYTSIVKNSNLENSIIEPGGLGNVMLVYLEPTYAHVKTATISTSELYVPALGKNVRMKFTQLVLDYRKNPSGMFTTLYGGENSQVGNTLELNLISEIDASGNRIYNGVICLYVQLEDFAGLEATITAELMVETYDGKSITRTRDFLTTYLPGTEVSYDENKAIEDGYLIQKGTYNNEIHVKVYGYQFNADPRIEFAWKLPTDEDGNLINTDYKYEDDNKQIIVDKTDPDTKYRIGDYVSYYLANNYDEITYNPADDSYTIKLMLNVKDNIMAPFVVKSTLSLTTNDGQIKVSSGEENSITFYPVDYILNSIYVNDLSDGRKNIAINKSSNLQLMFTTDSNINDYSEEINKKLLTYAENYDVNNGLENYKLASLFSYYKNGTITFADTDLYTEFEFSLVNGSKMTIHGLEKFSGLVGFGVYYGYRQNKNGVYELVFGEKTELTNASYRDTSFTLNIYALDEQEEVIIYSADDIYNSSSASWNLVEGANYVLMNDIVLENVVPITTKIGGFDGNNRVITVKNFLVDEKRTNYGLFDSIGTYTVKNEQTGISDTRQTILKNMIVDYRDCVIAVNHSSATKIVFGGLVAENNGGLIYNCDVMNLNASANSKIDLIVANNANVTFGGLVGVNNGIITNSRVGRDSYTKITATTSVETTIVKYAGGLTFSIFNQEGSGYTTNNFVVVAGGFVGENKGTISSSYLANTNLINYSTNETSNITSGFVGENSGTISYSYAKASTGRNGTITTSNPYSRKYVVESRGNGIVSGFVYNNSGNINNSYANLEIASKSAYVSGFVYNNTGVISESYAATTMNADALGTIAEQPFVGVNSSGSLMSSGTLENTYYLMRSSTDNPYLDGDKDVAQGLNAENFQEGTNLIGFSFVLSNTKSEREEGVWSYYNLNNEKRILPELMNTDNISHSHRFVVDVDETTKSLRSSASYTLGSKNNPYTISNVKEYNEVLTSNDTDNDFVGYVRFINNIDFNNDETAIKTRSNFTLGSNVASSKTSIEGNGMSISGIYLDVGEAIVEKVGLFAGVKNAYIKNLTLNFATPTTDGQFSTTTATYSGGLAGTIEDSAIINITLNGNKTTLTGSNFVGGLAGHISGNSLIYSISTNLNVKASGTESLLYYSESDYNAMNLQLTTHSAYNQYLKRLSYAGGVAGVMDLSKRSNIEYNVQFIDVRGDKMTAKTFKGVEEANIIAEFAGGVAGYANELTNSFKLRYFIGNEESIRGNTAVGGLFGVNLGSVVASQVSAEEDVQFVRDTEFGGYIIDLENETVPSLDETKVGNLTLLEGYKYVGGLTGIDLGSKNKAVYSKASIASGEVVGGLSGISVAGSVTYSYAVPYININSNIKKAGGLIGAAYGVAVISPERNQEIIDYELLLRHKHKVGQNTDIQFTYSSMFVDNSKVENINGVYDYICADYGSGTSLYIESNRSSSLMYVFAGNVNYSNNSKGVPIQNQLQITSKASETNAFNLYNSGDPYQTVAFSEIFSGWSLIEYWSLDESKYLPLLVNRAVDNFIDIEEEGDLAKIKSNPNGKFRIIDDILIDDSTTLTSNWILPGEFTGVIVGEKESDGSRPTISIAGLKPNINNESSGFFEKTYGATISNIAIEWTCDDGKAIDLTGLPTNGHITMIGGLSCQDTNSLISNVEVRASYENEEADGYIINDNSKTIGGFGGIVGNSVNTNILGCVFAGRIQAKVEGAFADGVYVGGLVGTTETQNSSSETNTAVITNSRFGVKNKAANEENTKLKYPTSKFDLTITNDNVSPVYIGGVVGKAKNAALASNEVGGTDYVDDYQSIEINLTMNEVSEKVFIGGIGGKVDDGGISSSNALTKINIDGKTTSTLLVGGLAGEYTLAGQAFNSGISQCNTKSDIIVKTASNAETSTLMVSSGVASLGSNATISQCLFTGDVDTEEGEFTIVYAGGAVACQEQTGSVKIDQTTTYSNLMVGNSSTKQIYAGGFVGFANNITILCSNSLGRIVPITHEDAEDIYAGGLIGKAQGDIVVSNSFTTSSIIADSIAGKVLPKLTIGALIGNADTSKTNISKTYYSSDIALFADENYDSSGNPIGTNLTANTMLTSNAWHNGANGLMNGSEGVWLSKSDSLPYLSALEEALIKYGILVKPTGETSYNYAEGSVMRPVVIETSIGNNSYNFKSEYTYYILKKANATNLPKFNNALNGFIFGYEGFTLTEFGVVHNNLDQGIDGTYYGIIPAVLKHSAVSGLGVTLNGELSKTTGNVGVIAGLNNGVIFNSSVQGDGINVTNASRLGLIAAKNNGLISCSFSSAEVLSSSCEVGGIVHTNGGKIQSSYFTGYINSSAKSAGVVVESDVDSTYLYNNFMAGVITGGKGENTFAGSTYNIFGSNNFIDIHSDISYSYNCDNNMVDEKVKTIIKPITTKDLMSGNGLAGTWYSTVNSNGQFIANGTDTEDNYILSSTFGYNYNYPIYRFNKFTASGSDLIAHDIANQRYTGTGVPVQIKDDEGNITINDVETRGTNLTDKSSSEYKDAFKIPHLGVLESVHGLTDRSRNYVLIYDIDGKINEDVYVQWTAVGAKIDDGHPSGFKPLEGVDPNFNGVFVSNKYYGTNSATDIRCLITNLSHNGLFANIQDAYIGNVKLGSFYNMKQSGALGTNIVGGTSVDLITFVNDSEIIGVNTVVVGSENQSNYYGGLFGEVAGQLTVTNFKTTEDQNKYLKLTSSSANAGLIAGKATANITFAENDVENLLNVAFDGNNFAGGIVAELNKDVTINVADNAINLYSSGSENFTANLGGVVGISYGGTINKASVVFASNQYKANNFGGIIAKHGSEQDSNLLSVNGFTIGGSSVDFIGNFDISEANTRFYGLLAGEQSATLTVEGFKIANLKTITVTSSANPNYDENQIYSGVGLWVGKMGADLTIKHKENSNTNNVAINVVAVPNLGYVGYSLGKKLSVDGNFNHINLIGTTNVGGLYGYLKGNITKESFGLTEEGYINLVNYDKQFATVVVNGSEAGETHRNFGGLFGRWDGEFVGACAGDEGNVDEKDNVISSKNNIEMGTNSVAYNVGGIAGKLTATQIGVSHITFSGSIENNGNAYNSVEINNKDGDNSLVKMINVGGIAGFVQASDNGTTLTQTINTGIVSGYQNVGGLYGYLAGKITVNNPESISDTKSEDGETTYDVELNYDSGVTGAVIHEDEETKFYVNAGYVYGVINVGGAVGFAGENVEISQIYSKANIYGNAHVGGLVGFANTAILKNNLIAGGVIENAAKDEGLDAAAIEEMSEGELNAGAVTAEEFGVVKGVYYNAEVAAEGGKTETHSFIPTAVGGLVGVSADAKISNNILQGIKVTSANESEDDNAVISTVRNYMSTMTIGNADANTMNEYSNPNALLDFDKIIYQLDFNETRSGFGGFAGTGDAGTLKLSGMNTNYMVDIEVNAQLGVNVATYYGALKIDELLVEVKEEGETPQAETPTNINLVPNLYASEGKTIDINGGYMTGGIVGFIDAVVSDGNGLFGAVSLSNNNLTGSATINLQTEYKGFYVGGLFGRTNANNINGISIVSNASVNIKINTDNCYYAGGLIGRAEVSGNATITGYIGETYKDSNNEIKPSEKDLDNDSSNDTNKILFEYGENKYSDDRKNFGGLIGMLKIGKSSKANEGFTVSVNGLHKMPFTINTIENVNYLDGASRFNADETTLYAEASYVNLDSFNITGSQGDWYKKSSTDTKVYENPLTGTTGWHKEYTGFRQIQRNIPASENNGASWDSITVLYDAANITHVGTGDKDGKDHIYYTVYKQSEFVHTLYSRMGIATAYLNSDQSKENFFATPQDAPRTFWESMQSWFVEGVPPNIWFIDCNNSKNDLQNLDYFKWGTLKEEGKADWNTYTTMGGKNSDGLYAEPNDNITYQSNSENTVKMCYFVEGYTGGDVQYKNQGNFGAYFVFEVVFENESASYLPYNYKEEGGNLVAQTRTTKYSDDYLPTSGSIFSVTGVIGDTLETARKNEDKFQFWKFIVKGLAVVLSIVLVFVTHGAAAWLVKVAWISLIASSVVMAMSINNYVQLQKNAMMASQYYLTSLGSHYGFMSNVYSRDLYYLHSGDRVQLDAESDDIYISIDNGNFFNYYSATRPSDYHVNKYVGYKVNVSNINLGGESKSITVDSVNGQGECNQFSENDIIVYENVETTISGKEESLAIGYKELDKTYWILSPKYEIRGGQYYINSIYSDINLYKVSLEFTHNSGESGATYTFDGGATYVRGTFDGAEYKYSGYAGNNLEYEDNADGTRSYSLNGRDVTSSAEYKNRPLNYVARTGWDDIRKNAYKNDNVNIKTFGYNYFEGAYYTAGGTYEGDLIKYANFKFVKDVDSSNSADATYGTKNIDYVVREYRGYKQNNLGDLLKIDDQYITINPENRYSDSEGLIDDPFGDYLKHDGVCYQITDNKRYIKATKYGLFTIVSVNGTATESTNLNVGIWDFAIGDQIIVALRPSHFVNPYKTTISGLKDSILYTDDEESKTGISHNPTYYIYEGGYVSCDIDGNSYGSGEKYPSVFTAVPYSVDKYDTVSIQLKGVTGQTTYKDLVDNWDKYKSYDCVTFGAPISELYRVKGNTLYMIDNSLTVDRDGKLSKMRLSLKDVDKKSMTTNMFLSNSSVGLYTRYKYINGGNVEDFITSPWGKYNIIPEEGSTSLNNGQSTTFVESARVLLSKNPNQQINCGIISIN